MNLPRRPMYQGTAIHYIICTNFTEVILLVLEQSPKRNVRILSEHS